MRIFTAALCTLALAGTASAQDQPPAPVTVTVDWSATPVVTTPGMFGLNSFTGFSPEVAANATYQENITYMYGGQSAGLIRFHSAEMHGDSSKKHGWIDTENERWDAEKIKAALAARPANAPNILMCISHIPPWMKKNEGRLDPSEYQNFAHHCAELVKIVNIDLKQGVSHWEITNEWDISYWVNPLKNLKNAGPSYDWDEALAPTAADREKRMQMAYVEDLAKVYNLAAEAMKQVDPTIQTGGPAVARPDFVEQCREFAKLTLPHLQFFSFHVYGSGSAKDSDLSIFERTKKFGSTAEDINKMLAEVSPGKEIPSHCNEFNVSWTWETRDERMKNWKGAVFDALTLVRLARSGTDVLNAWNERDGVYGKMDSENKLRPAAHTFNLFNRYFCGKTVSPEISDPKWIEAWACQVDGGSRSILIVNSSMSPKKLTLNAGDWAPTEPTATVYTISAAGFQETHGKWADYLGTERELPPHSYIVLAGK